jgi:uncharacterized protein YbjT (DUF2867 family)
MKAFIAGATGGTGRRIVDELLQRGISVRAMVRDLDAAKATLPNQVELVLGNVLDKKAIEEAIACLFCSTWLGHNFYNFIPRIRLRECIHTYLSNLGTRNTTSK